MDKQNPAEELAVMFPDIDEHLDRVYKNSVKPRAHRNRAQILRVAGRVGLVAVAVLATGAVVYSIIVIDLVHLFVPFSQ